MRKNFTRFEPRQLKPRTVLHALTRSCTPEVQKDQPDHEAQTEAKAVKITFF